MPAHSHILVNGIGAGQVNATTVLNTATGSLTNEPDNGTTVFASGGSSPTIYTTPTPTIDSVGGAVTTLSGSTSITGGGVAFDSRNPFLGIYTSIALTGMFPSRD